MIDCHHARRVTGRTGDSRLAELSPWLHEESDQWIGARRLRAEQGSPGVRTGNREWLKGVIAMVKHVFSWAWSFRSAALVALGWIAFVTGLLVSPVWARLVLLTASRILPQATSS